MEEVYEYPEFWLPNNGKLVVKFRSQVIKKCQSIGFSSFWGNNFFILPVSGLIGKRDDISSFKTALQL